MFVVGAICFAGCTSPHQAPAATLTPAAGYAATTISPTPLPSQTVTVAPPALATTPAAITPTAAPPDPTDITKIQFTKYSDNDFSLEYPATWNVSRSTYWQNPCISNSSTYAPATSDITTRCYYTQIQTIGPFDFGEYSDAMKKPGRIVTFTSADAAHKVVAYISDFLDNQNGNYIINPDLSWVKDQVVTDYPDVGADQVGNYQYFRSGNTMCVSYSVTTTTSSTAYPLAYASKNYITVHHWYQFAYISTLDDIRKYNVLEAYVLNSITPNDIS